jgi:flagellar biosynthesis/type III secretory pathway protein FliH
LISFDWAMKRLLRSNAHFGILEGFLTELLREEIQILEILESESNKETAADKQNRVDLKARNAGGEIILIEVQYQRQFDDLQRILHSMDQWIYFLKHEEVPEGFSARGLQEAKEQLDILKLPEAERRAYARYQDDLHQQASMVESSYGWGMHQGRKLGREEGREEGQLQERRRIAQSLLDLIADDQLLAEKTGLSAGDVRGLREERQRG